MTKFNKLILLAGIAILCGCGIVSICGCGGSGGSAASSSPTRLAPEGLFGTWRLVRIGGGITGQGQPVTEETIVTFTRDGRTFGGKVPPADGGGRYQVIRSIRTGCVNSSGKYGPCSVPVLEYLSPPRGVGYTVAVIDERLLLGEAEVSDAFGYTYERVP